MTTTHGLPRRALTKQEELRVRLALHNLCCVHVEQTGDTRKNKGSRQVLDSELNRALGADGCDCLTREVVVYGARA